MTKSTFLYKFSAKGEAAVRAHFVFGIFVNHAQLAFTFRAVRKRFAFFSAAVPIRHRGVYEKVCGDTCALLDPLAVFCTELVELRIAIAYLPFCKTVGK